MGFFDAIGDLFGGASNNAGSTAQSTTIQTPVTAQDYTKAQGQVQGGLQQQLDLANSLASQGSQGMQSQTSLGQALQAEALGLGPNPASAMLATQTGNNIAQQGALMAGQRGAGANVGLMARQAAQQGGNIQQQGVGQNAVLQAQQQLAAQNQLQQLAANQIGQQAGAIGNYNQFAQGNQGQVLGGIQGQNAANVGMQSNMNTSNLNLAGVNANNTAGAIGGLFNAAGGAASMGGKGGGGAAMTGGGGAGASGGAMPMMMAYDGGEVPDHVNGMAELYHGHRYEHKSNPKLHKVPESDRFKQGGEVPGKPKVDHNDIKNDVVDAKLTPKEIVLPLSVTESKNPGDAAKKFVEAIQRKHGEGGDEHGDFKAALKDAIKARKKK